MMVVGTSMSNDLMKKICQDKKRMRIKNNDIAKALKVSGGAVTQYFSEGEQIRIGLFHFTKLIELVYENDVETQRELLFGFICTTDRPINLRLGLEYAYMNGETEILQYIIEKELNGKRPNDEWASVYYLLLMRIKGKLRGAELLKATEDLMTQRKLKQNEMRILVHIIKMYAYFDMDEHGSMLKLTKELPEVISTISNPYIKEAYYVRMLEGYAHGYLRDNDLENARKTALELTSGAYSTKFPLFVSTGYHVLGQSYLFENFDEIENNIKSGLSILEKYSSPTMIARKKEINKTYDFAKVYWSKKVEEERQLNDGERLHLMVKEGKKEEAHNLLEYLEKKNGRLSAFQIYYKGLLENDALLYRKSLELFRKQGNKFYLKLPLIQLQKLSKDKDEKLELIW